MTVRIHKLRDTDRPLVMAKLRDLEDNISYPYGKDTFRIDHGEDYFRFFDRLGKVDYYLAIDADKLCAVAAAVLRPVPIGNGSEPVKAWYLCDLKIHPAYRGQGLSLRFFRLALLPSLLKCRRAYAISMDNTGTAISQTAAILAKVPGVSFRKHCKLKIFTLSNVQVQKYRTMIEALRGPISFLSLNGVKDLIMGSTGLPLPLAHIQFGAAHKVGVANPIIGYQHMIAAPEADTLAKQLEDAGIDAEATATILHFRMSAADFKFVLTSDI